MKIFFHASQSQITEPDYKFNQHIYDYLISSGHEHTSSYFKDVTPETVNTDKIQTKAKTLWTKQQDSVKKADVMVFGPSNQSIGIGICIEIAMHLSKPVIFLTKDKHSVPFLINALDYNKLMIIECTSKNYQTVLPRALKKAAKLIDKRFTLLLPPDVVEMLDNEYKRSGETRSEYIRNLIKEDQQKRGLLPTTQD